MDADPAGALRPAMTSTNVHTLARDPVSLTWDSGRRVLTIKYALDARLNVSHASMLVDTLTSWIGSEGERFALLADAAGLRSVDAEYRATTTRFFKEHRDELSIALFNIGPLIRVLAELFRVGSGLQVKAFGEEQDARDWLREQGVG